MQETDRLLADRKQAVLAYQADHQIIMIAPSSCWWHLWCRFAPAWAIKRWPPTMYVATIEIDYEGAWNAGVGWSQPRGDA